MGDDLLKARQFCTDASQHLAMLLGQAESGVAPDDKSQDALIALQQSAKAVQGRAIYRAAHQAIEASQALDGLRQYHGQLLSLNKLVGQYQSGLEEIEAALGNEADDKTPLPAAAPDSHISVPPDIHARFEQAREILLPLLPHCDTPEHAKALSRLAQITPQHGVAAKTIEAIETPAVLSVDFETLMPGFTSHVLSAARIADKTVSISYAADNVWIPNEKAALIEEALCQLGTVCVKQVLEPAALRQYRGESGAGHIAVTAAARGVDLIVTLDCAGTEAREATLSQSLSGMSVSSVFSHNVQSLTLTAPLAEGEAKDTQTSPLIAEDILPILSTELAL